MPVWLKRKNSGASRNSINNLKVRILNDPQRPFHSIFRTGSKVLTSLRRHRVSASNALFRSSDRLDPPDYAEEPDSTAPESNSMPTSTILPMVTYGPITVFETPNTAAVNGMDGQESPRNGRTAERHVTESAKSWSAPESQTPREWLAGIRHCISSPNLATSVVDDSYTQSSTSHPTVIHRRSLASRPTVVSRDQDLDSFVPSPPFGFYKTRDSESTSRRTQFQPSSALSQASTAPTSMLSSNNSGQNAVLASIPELSNHVLEFHNGLDMTMRNQKATIATVETAAAAKIYLETHFNKLLATTGNGRLRRQQHLDSHIANSPMPTEEREDTRKRWIQAESDCLRLTRVLKSQRGRKPDPGTVSHYDIIRVLGKGSFGVVRLVRDKTMTQSTPSPPRDTPSLSEVRDELFAMKIIRKSAMLRSSQEGHLRAERDFLVASEKSQWVVRLIESFQDPSHLYLVMEYMVGGDFLGLLQRWDMFPEHVARFYIAEMILCVEEAHRMKWIHRDVKPDNFLISASGHLKISDFGLAFDGHWSHNQTYYNQTRRSLLDKLEIPVNGDARDIDERRQLEKSQSLDMADGNSQYASYPFREKPSDRPEGDSVLKQLNCTWRRRLAKSVVGTSQYMAPEVIHNEYYDGRCDWWSIGVILYECLFGCTPFYCDNREDTKARIVRHRRPLCFPTAVPRFHRPSQFESRLLPSVSERAQDLINALLSPKESRLSSRRYLQNDQRGRRGYYQKTGSRVSSAYFVFENDAEDIKMHGFFEGMDWHTLHLQRPHFIPRVAHNQPITKYFDSEQDILGSSDETRSTLTGEEEHHQLSRMPSLVSQLRADILRNPDAPVELVRVKHERALRWLAENDPRTLRRLYKQKPRKRARDKILRDPSMTKTAMKVRKNGAFLGYTYRKADFALECGSGNVSSRGSILPDSDFGQLNSVAA